MVRTVRIYIKEAQNAHLGAFAAMSAFFVVLSFFPLIMLIFTILAASDADTVGIANLFADSFSGFNMEFLADWIKETTYKYETSASVSILFTAWSAGKAFNSLSGGFHSLMQIHEQRSYIHIRIRGLFYSLIFTFVVVSLIFIGLFGDYLHRQLATVFYDYARFLHFSKLARKLYVFFSLFIIIVVLYKLIPDWKSYEKSKYSNKRLRWPSALYAALVTDIVIYLFTGAFAFYLVNSNNLNVLYGSLVIIIALLLWLYGTMYVLLLGFKLSLYMNR